ncbi:MAG: alpha-D-ribose 1-methylphosphonate 5-triphosphate diphosphatase [Hyphomicrobiales bacterium]|nr:alpha-D-ribose 1-methylphosphonate 5-triphosphate diphosphatase [Hyphomicrobiales bacterium]
MNIEARNLTQGRSAEGRPLRPIRIVRGLVLTGGAFSSTDVTIADGRISDALGANPDVLTIDAHGLYILPGIIDIHGDGFERLIHPRPGVAVDPLTALLEADRQFISNGITTAYHSVTWSWEGGTRGAQAALSILEAMTALRPHLLTDTRYHLRHETFNLDAEHVILDWIAEGRIDCLAFNDHMAGTIKQRHRPDKMAGMITRSGLSEAEFHHLIERVHARSDEVPASIARLAAAARRAGLPMLSHDDMTPQMRGWYRDLGCAIAEFPINVETTKAAADAGDPIVFGAPNVIRGGSHTGCPSAAEMAAQRFCTILASDYYYPALPLAPFRLSAQGIVPLAEAWGLVSSGPAHALGLNDRGRIETGLRADLVLIEDRSPLPPRIVGTMIGGRLACMGDAGRIIGSG